MTGRLKNVLLVGLVVVMINLPFVHGTWQQHRIDRDGVDVTATVTDHDEDDGRWLVTFEVADSEDQPGFGGSATRGRGDVRRRGGHPAGARTRAAGLLDGPGGSRARPAATSGW